MRKLVLDLLSRLLGDRPAATTRAFFEENPLPMWVFDVETYQFLDVNAAAVERYGYTRAEFLAMTIKDIRPPEDLESLLAVVEDRTRPRHHSPGVFRHRTKAGKLIDVEIVSHAFEHRGRAARLVLAHDVTERLRLEEQVRQAQKMEAVGQLAGGVAHDFNNLLTVISTSTDLALQDPTLSEETRADLLEARRAAGRAAELTRQLLALGRRQTLRPRVLDVNAAVAEAETMLRRVLREDLLLELRLSRPLGHVFVDPVQLEVALLNLVVNARDAMPHGGTITIDTRGLVVGEELGRSLTLAPGEYVAIAVADQGSGMSRDVMKRAFEPFFTTKPVGKGTGLGLATAYGIARQSGGTIQLESAPGEGTTATIYLPRRAADGEVVAAVRAAADAPRRGDETILVVEDEDAVRAVAKRVLSAAGYRVLTAHNGADALSLVAGRSEPVDLLLSDVVMPEMGGPELAARLRAGYPELRVLFVSGHAADEFGRHVSTLEAPLLHKPFTPDALVAAVRAALE